MAWWQTLLIGVVPAFITLLGLLCQLGITSRLEKWRRSEDAEERRLDRESAERAQTATRRAALEDYWREERLRVHTSMITFLNSIALRAKVEDQFSRGLLTDEEYNQEKDWALSRQKFDGQTADYQSEDYLARAQLVTGERASDAAFAALSAARAWLHWATSGNFVRNADGEWVTEDKPRSEYVELERDFERAMERYRSDARYDLGTSYEVVPRPRGET